MRAAPGNGAGDPGPVSRDGAGPMAPACADSTDAARAGQSRAMTARHALALLLLLTVACAPGPAPATQEYILPTLFDVTGVEAGDVLNIRAAPSARAEIIGAFDHDARNIEVVAHDRTGRWAQVNTAERSGWVALRYLAYRTDVWTGDALPRGLRCLGTEPFWSLRPGDGVLTFSTPGGPDRALALEAVLATGVFRDPRRALVARDGDRRLTAVMTPKACSDGMSDRAYGLEVNVVVEADGQAELLSGCCSIQPQRPAGR